MSPAIGEAPFVVSTPRGSVRETRTRPARAQAAPARADSAHMNRAGLLAAAAGAVAIGLAPVVPLVLAHNHAAFAVPDVHFYAVSADGARVRRPRRDARHGRRAPARPAHGRHRRRLHRDRSAARRARADDARIPDRGRVHRRGRRLGRPGGAARRRRHPGRPALAPARARLRPRPRAAAGRRRRHGRSRSARWPCSTPRPIPNIPVALQPARLVDRRGQRADLRRARAARAAHVPAHAPHRRPGRRRRPRVARDRRRDLPAEPALVGRLLDAGTCSSWAPSWSSWPRS